jgi:hypothetical protein
MVIIFERCCVFCARAQKPDEEWEMIKNALIAQQVSDLMVDIQSRLNHSIVLVQQKCSPEEFKAYRLAVGRIMGEMLLEVVNPLYVQHPALKPPEME